MSNEMTTDNMSNEEVIEVLKGIVFNGFERTTPKERQSLDLAIKALENIEERPQGDLISREALKESTERLYHETKDGIVKFGIEKAYNLIDNAPTVEPQKVLVANVTFDKDQLEQIVRDRVIEPIKNGELVLQTEKRPTGEWVYGEDECGQDGWFCSECGFFVPWYYEYYENDIDFIREYKACPHCLAEMVTYTGKDRDTKGGAEE